MKSARLYKVTRKRFAENAGIVLQSLAVFGLSFLKRNGCTSEIILATNCACIRRVWANPLLT